jgi:hypothetical protein
MLYFFLVHVYIYKKLYVKKIDFFGHILYEYLVMKNVKCNNSGKMQLLTVMLKYILKILLFLHNLQLTW